MPADAPLTITELDAILRDGEVPDRVLSTLRHLLIVHDYLETRVGRIAERVQGVESTIGTPIPARSGDETLPL